MARKVARAGTTWCTTLAGTQGESCAELQNQLGAFTPEVYLFQDSTFMTPMIHTDEAGIKITHTHKKFTFRNLQSDGLGHACRPSFYKTSHRFADFVCV